MLEPISFILMFLLDIIFVYSLIQIFRIIINDSDANLVLALIDLSGSIVVSGILQIFIKFKGQISSIILTFASIIIFGIIFITIWRKETKPKSEESYLEKIPSESWWECFSLPVAILTQFTSIIIHIVGIYIPLIEKLIQWIF